jgi:hypothetical protein
MNIRSAEVSPHGGGTPTQWNLFIEVDEFPKKEDFTYQTYKVSPFTLYWGEKNGFVSFYVEDPLDRHGYGGATFDLRLEDGSVVALKGPWSSRTSVMNAYFPHSVEVYLRKPGWIVELAGYALLVPIAKVILEELVPDFVLEQEEYEYKLRPKRQQ